MVVLPWYEVAAGGFHAMASEVNCCDPEQLQGLLRARLAAVSPPSPCFPGKSTRHEGRLPEGL